MPIHDWGRVHPRLYNDFRLVWLSYLSQAFNRGILPTGYYSLNLPFPASPVGGNDSAMRIDPSLSPFIVICREANDSVAAFVSIARAVEPEERRHRSRLLPSVGRVMVHAHPAGEMDVTAHKPDLTSHILNAVFSVGDPIPAMPLYIEAERHVLVPLEETYLSAWDTFPNRWRSVIEGTAT